MTTQPKRNYINILLQYIWWVDAITFANDMYDRHEPDKYVREKYAKIHSDLGSYLDSLDTHNQMKLMQLAMEYHEDRDKVIQRSHWYIERNLQKQGEQ